MPVIKSGVWDHFFFWGGGTHFFAHVLEIVYILSLYSGRGTWALQVTSDTILWQGGGGKQKDFARIFAQIRPEFCPNLPELDTLAIFFIGGGGTVTPLSPPRLIRLYCKSPIARFVFLFCDLMHEIMTMYRGVV